MGNVSTRFIKHKKQNIRETQQPILHLTTRGRALTDAKWLIYGLRVSGLIIKELLQIYCLWICGAAHICNHKLCVTEHPIVGLIKYIFFGPSFPVMVSDKRSEKGYVVFWRQTIYISGYNMTRRRNAIGINLVPSEHMC